MLSSTFEIMSSLKPSAQKKKARFYSDFNSYSSRGLGGRSFTRRCLGTSTRFGEEGRGVGAAAGEE